MKKYLLLLSLFLTGTMAFSQGVMLFGAVTDQQEQPLPGAHLSLLTLSDSTLQATQTNEMGRFRLAGVAPGDYKLKATFLGYETQVQQLSVGNENMRVGRIVLEEGSINLGEVEVKEKLPQATLRGDTTQFNAGAFKTNPDANAEDLVRKMPGVVVEEGRVQAQGEDVREVLVDGKPFFGNDPTAALRNLPAEVIDKIQVFDRTSDQSQFTGFDDGETTKTINIITKTNMRNGQFGKVYAGYGADGEYQGGGSVNFFSGDSRLSVIGQSNNINQQNFAADDLLGVLGGQGGRGGRGGGGPRGGGRRGGGANAGDFLVNQQNGIATTHALGLNYTDKWGEKMEIGGSYFFNRSDNDALTSLFRNYITDADFGQVYDEEGLVASRNTNHRLNFRLEYEIDPRNSIILQPRLSIQRNDGLEQITGLNILGDSLLSRTNYELRPELDAIDFSNRLLFRHRFTKRGRTFSINFNTEYDNTSGGRFLLSENLFFTDMTLSDSLDQFSDLFSDGWTLESRASYTEPVGEKGQIELNYEASYQQGNSEQETYDFEERTLAYSDFNPTLSNVFNKDYLAQEVGGGYRIRAGELMANFRLNYQWSTLEGEQLFPTTDQISQSFSNLLPSAFMRWRFSRENNLIMGYRTRTSPPSISQLQAAIDNSNPLQLRTGNPELEQDYQHRLFMRYSATDTEKSRVFYAMLSGQASLNYIANSTFIARRDTLLAEGILLQQGAQLIRPVNLDGYRNLRAFVTYGLPIGLLRSNLNINLSGDYSRQPGEVNGRLNQADNTGFGVGLVLSSNISERVDFTLSSRSNVNSVTNSLNTALDTRYFSQNSSVALNLIIGPGFVFRTNLNHQLYSGLSEGFDQNYWLWNMGLAKKLFKNERGEIQLSVFDLLKQNTSIQRNITEAYIEDLQTEVLQQYFMMTFTYQIRNFGSPPEKQEEERRGPWNSRD